MAEFIIDDIRKSFARGPAKNRPAAMRGSAGTAAAAGTGTAAGGRLNVLNGVCLSGDTDEITVILGKSGCGKTTLLRILCGLEEQDAGSFSFPGEALPGMVFQEPRLMPWLSVWDNIEFGVPKEKRDPKETQELIDVVGLTGFERAKPAQLSGGMQHRAALARTLACRHSMVLMDEPFAALDYFTRAMMQRELLRIHQETGMGIIFVTHNIDEAILLGDRICILSDGRISAGFSQPAPGESAAGDGIAAPDGSAAVRDTLSEECIALKRRILSELGT